VALNTINQPIDLLIVGCLMSISEYFMDIQIRMRKSSTTPHPCLFDKGYKTSNMKTKFV
jgi:hypothetical protein